MMKDYPYYSQITPGKRVLALVTIGKEKFWWNGQVECWVAGQVKVAIEYEGMDGQRKSATITIDPKQIRFPGEGKR